MNAENMLKISCAECFTLGKIAQEIHAFSRGYPRDYSWNIEGSHVKISLIGAVFVPTLTGVQNLLKIKPLEPFVTLDDIKVYEEKEDIIMAEMMAQAVQDIAGADIGIGSSAGIGKGGVAVCNHEMIISGPTGVNADLRKSSFELIIRRQKSGIKKTLYLLEHLIKKELESLDSNNIIIKFR